VIADVQMPVLSGLDLLTLMHAQGYRVPFIFITAFPDESVRARALNAGAICFLAKPFAAPALINAFTPPRCHNAAKPGQEAVNGGGGGCMPPVWPALMRETPQLVHQLGRVVATR